MTEQVLEVGGEEALADVGGELEKDVDGLLLSLRQLRQGHQGQHVRVGNAVGIFEGRVRPQHVAGQRRRRELGHLRDLKRRKISRISSFLYN